MIYRSMRPRALQSSSADHGTDSALGWVGLTGLSRAPRALGAERGCWLRRKGLLLACCVALVLVAILRGAEAGDPRPGSREFALERQRRMRELHKIALELRDAVLRKDTEALLKYATRDERIGRYSEDAYSEFKPLLDDPKSWLYCIIFDTQCRLEHLRQNEGIPASNPYRVSVGEFFQAHREVRIKIHFFGTKKPDFGLESVLDLAQVAYVVAGSSADRGFPRTLSLQKWGTEFIDTCLGHTRRGWRYYGNIFGCPSD